MKLTLSIKEATRVLNNHFTDLLGDVVVEIDNPDTEALKDIVLEKIRSLSGNKIQAIKYIRCVSGMGLKESKDVIDAIWAGASNSTAKEMFEVVNASEIFAII